MVVEQANNGLGGEIRFCCIFYNNSISSLTTERNLNEMTDSQKRIASISKQIIRLVESFSGGDQIIMHGYILLQID